MLVEMPKRLMRIRFKYGLAELSAARFYHGCDHPSQQRDVKAEAATSSLSHDCAQHPLGFVGNSAADITQPVSSRLVSSSTQPPPSSSGRLRMIVIHVPTSVRVDLTRHRRL